MPRPRAPTFSRAVDREVVARHARRAEALLEALAHALAVELQRLRAPRRPPARPSRRCSPVTPCSTTSGTEPCGQAITGVPHDIASIIASPNGSGQSIGNSSATALPRKAGFSASPSSPTYSMNVPSTSGAMRCAPVGFVGAVDLGGDAQPLARAARDGDRALQALFRRDAAEEGEVVAARGRIERADVRGQAVVHGGDPVRAGERPALAVGDRDQRHLRELAIKRPQRRAGRAGRAAW